MSQSADISYAHYVMSPLWRHTVAWRHQTRDHSTQHRRFFYTSSIAKAGPALAHWRPCSQSSERRRGGVLGEGMSPSPAD